MPRPVSASRRDSPVLEVKKCTDLKVLRLKRKGSCSYLTADLFNS